MRWPWHRVKVAYITCSIIVSPLTLIYSDSVHRLLSEYIYIYIYGFKLKSKKKFDKKVHPRPFSLTWSRLFLTFINRSRLVTVDQFAIPSTTTFLSGSIARALSLKASPTTFIQPLYEPPLVIQASTNSNKKLYMFIAKTMIYCLLVVVETFTRPLLNVSFKRGLNLIFVAPPVTEIKSLGFFKFQVFHIYCITVLKSVLYETLIYF